MNVLKKLTRTLSPNPNDDPASSFDSMEASVSLVGPLQQTWKAFHGESTLNQQTKSLKEIANDR